MPLSPAPASIRSSAREKIRAAKGWITSTDWIRSKAMRREVLNSTPVSTRSSSSSMTNRVKRQET